jgi:hypothetical protein
MVIEVVFGWRGVKRRSRSGQASPWGRGNYAQAQRSERRAVVPHRCRDRARAQCGKEPGWVKCRAVFVIRVGICPEREKCRQGLHGHPTRETSWSLTFQFTVCAPCLGSWPFISCDLNFKDTFDTRTMAGEPTKQSALQSLRNWGGTLTTEVDVHSHSRASCIQSWRACMMEAHSHNQQRTLSHRLC